MLVKIKFQSFFILFLFLGMIVFAQDNQVNNDNDKKLKEEILAVFISDGEEGLRDFVKEKIDNIYPKSIVNFAEAGLNERNEDWLKISLILAEEKKNEHCLAFVHLEIGRYFISVGNYGKGVYYFEKALPILKKINNPDIQGYVSLMKEVIYALKKDDINKMEDIADKGLPFFEKMGDLRGQAGNYVLKGILYAYKSDHLKAIDMLEKALLLYEEEGDINGQGNVYLIKGYLYLLYKGDCIKSFDMYEKALLFFKNAGNLNGQGEVYNIKGDIYQYTGENLKALEMYDKALHFFEITKNIRKKAQVYMAKGMIYVDIGKNSNALEMYNSALNLLEIEGSLKDRGNVYMKMGEFYFKNGENARALEMNKKALNFFKEANDLNDQGNVYEINAKIYFYTGNISLALKLCEKALNIFKKVKNSFAQGFVSIIIGDIYEIIGERLKSLEVYHKALCYFEKAGYSEGQGIAYYGKGEIYSKINDYFKALDMYDKGLEIFEKTGSNIKDIVFVRKGYIYINCGDYTRALEMFKIAKSLYEEKGDTIGLSMVYSGMGYLYGEKGDYIKAKEMYGKAMALIDDNKDKTIGSESMLTYNGNICTRREKYSRAMEWYKSTLHFFEKWDDISGKGELNRRMGDFYFWSGDNSNAMEMYDKSLSFLEKSGSIESLSYVLHRKAQILAKLGKKYKALSLFEEAIEKLEKIRRQTAFSWMKMALMKKFYDQYDESAVFMLGNKYYDKGFKCIDSMKARVFLDQLAEGLVKLKKGINQELLQKRDDLVAKLSLFSKEISEAAVKKDEEKLKVLKDKYSNTELQFEDLLVKIRLENSLYASVQYPEPVTVDDLQKNILKANEVLIQYFITAEKIYVFLVSRKDFKVIALAIKEKDIQAVVNRYFIAVNKKDTGKMVEYGKKIYQAIFKPLETSLQMDKDIIIVPDRQLATIPFESFVIDDTNPDRVVYLLEKYRLKYIQSASALSFLRKYHKKEDSTSHFVGFGDPVYDYEKFREGKPERGTPGPVKGNEIKEIHRGKYDREGGLFNRLPGSGQEIEAIAGLFKKQDQKSVVYLREEATEENAKSLDMKQFDYIHFSCHGVLGDGFQSLLLSQIPTAKEDGYLTLNEIMNCDYHAKLVVLSACQTGKGKMERAEGVTGLTRAVMYAGTPAVVASLWNVSDIGTKELMVKFYSNILEKGMSKEEALRQAKLDMIKGGKYASPYFWSAFVMYGE